MKLKSSVDELTIDQMNLPELAERVGISVPDFDQEHCGYLIGSKGWEGYIVGGTMFVEEDDVMAFLEPSRLMRGNTLGPEDFPAR